MKTIALTLLASLFLVPLAASTSAQTRSADMVFLNGTIYTVNARQPLAQAIAVKGDRIVYVGTNAGARRYQAQTTRVVDLAGLTVVPGMTDSHYHLSGVGYREMNLNLEGTNTL